MSEDSKDAAAALLVLLKRTGTPAERFSREANIGRSTVRRVLAGHPVSYRVAKAISEATDGEIGVVDLMEGSR